MAEDLWTEIRIVVSTGDLEAAAAVASMTVPYGIYVEDYSDLEAQALEIAHIDLIDEALLKKDRTHGIIHVYISPEENPQEAISYIEARLSAEKIEHTVECGACADEDWQNNWKKYYTPIRVGEKLLIRPVWIDDYTAEGRSVLDLEPGLAFGSGSHETTRLCLETVETLVTPRTEVLDVGCGSGILSVAALLLGAKSAVGVDIDKLAVKAARENGERNGYTEPRYRVLEGDLTDRVTGTYSLIVANIVADAVIALTPGVRTFLAPGGRYVVSGIIDTREEDVLSALSSYGFRVVGRREQNGWICLCCAAE